ncbi:MAG: signal peptide peptidase SppA [Patescibacteria group bacterium]|jgi:protease-4
MVKAVLTFFREVFRKVISIIRTLLLYTIVITILLTILSLVSGFVFNGDGNENYIKERVIRNEGGQDKIVIAQLSGLILSDSNQTVLGTTNTIISPDKFQRIFAQIKRDPLVKALIIDINSPGGSPVASDRIFEMITNFKRETGIPVVFLMGDMTTSGGYYIASAANHIVANPATLTGSIGVIMETYNLEKLYEKLGVSKTTFKKGEYKDILNESRPITEEENEIIETLNENTYNLFISRVASGRNLPEENIRNIANGQIYSGRQAKDLQLVDSLGNQDEALYQAKLLANLERFQVVEYKFSSLFTDLFGETNGSLSFSSLLRVILQPKNLYQQY